MNIDFSFSIEDWQAIIDQFLKIISDFFWALGIKLFPDSAEPTTAAPTTEEDTTLAE